jgi:hypothetical protein
MQAKALIDFFMRVMLFCRRANVNAKGKDSVVIGGRSAARDSSTSGFALLFDKPLQSLRVLVVRINLKRLGY